MLAAFRALLALVWWRFCHFLAYNLHVRGLKPTSQFFHKVVVIGDDFAAGIGDYITVGSAGGGIAEHLKKIVAYDDKASGMQSQLSLLPLSIGVYGADAALQAPLTRYFSMLPAGSPQLGHHQRGRAWIHDGRLAHVVAEEGVLAPLAVTAIAVWVVLQLACDLTDEGCPLCTS
ncbi:hypothetical protein PHYPSEUDO_007443 [Phytophthora pseudosyringae]|uniref:Uncharacterized protein n=1 Tax=Phytophthora pseudosyringae TaxID=221518 RepID=A0A8T1WJK0_9STRA|nr:hypothetical protein PHYPSEUDO_007443 [Phytophthora pseudosyringae]